MSKGFISFGHSVSVVFFLDRRPLIVEQSANSVAKPSSMERPALAREWVIIHPMAIEMRRLAGISIGT